MKELVHLEDENHENNLLENHQFQKSDRVWNTPLLRQVFVVLSPVSLMLCAGIGMGTATVMIPQIKNNNETIQLTQDEESWLYALHGFGSTPVVLTTPYLSQVIGYKLIFIAICFSMIASFILQYVATSALHLLIATLFQGFTMGGNVTIGVIILSEYADPKYRGSFLVFKSATYFWGIWISNIIGTFSSWSNIPLVGIWPAIYALASSFTWSESPYWLARRNRMDECKKAFRWLRGEGRDAENELALLTNLRPTQERPTNTIAFLKRTLLLRQFYLPFFLNIAMFLIYTTCGKIVCQSYVLVIIKEITKNDTTAYTGMLIMDGVTILGMYIGSYIAAKVRRRTMFISTTASTIFFLYLFSVYLYLIKFDIITQNNVISLGLLILYSFSVSWGPMLLCVSIFSEITPMRFKAFITTTTVCFMYVLQSMFIKLAPLIFKNAGLNGTFAVYGTLTVFPLLFVYKYLPETNKKTLNDIENIFAKEKCSSNENDSKIEAQEILNSKRNKEYDQYYIFYFT